jgi:hypothetical protein
MSVKTKTKQPYKEEHYEEELEETVRQSIEFYKNKFVRVDNYINDVLRSLKMKNMECEYIIDELPYFYAWQPIGDPISEDNYVRYEYASDEIICRNLSVPERYTIYIPIKRVYTHIGNVRSFLILDVGNIFIRKE